MRDFAVEKNENCVGAGITLSSGLTSEAKIESVTGLQIHPDEPDPHFLRKNNF